ncbi:kinase-like domain-containing protein [Aspergillus crustosus]
MSPQESLAPSGEHQVQPHDQGQQPTHDDPPSPQEDPWDPWAQKGEELLAWLDQHYRKFKFDGHMPMGSKYPELDWSYGHGGNHPLHLSEVIGEDTKYRIVHKLGCGSFGVVWMCKVVGSEPSRYVAAKVLTADASTSNSELATLEKLEGFATKNPNFWKNILRPLESFKITGPNGTHDCLIYPVAGGPVSEIVASDVPDPQAYLRTLTRQAAEAMATFHAEGLCHGDFRPGNILMRLNGLDGLSLDEIYIRYGMPTAAEVSRPYPPEHDGTEEEDAPTEGDTKGQPAKVEKPAPCPPEYMVYLGEDNEYAVKDFVTDQLCVIDWGESHHSSNPPEYGTGIPLSYASPELALDRKCGPASDIWALACTMYEIRSGNRLFPVHNDCYCSYMYQLVKVLGIPPESIWEPYYEHWKAGLFAVDEDAYPDALVIGMTELGGTAAFNRTADKHLNKRIFQMVSSPDPSPEDRLVPEDEKPLFKDLIVQMLEWDPEKRPSIQEVLQHPWFSYDDDKKLTKTADGDVLLTSDSPTDVPATIPEQTNADPMPIDDTPESTIVEKPDPMTVDEPKLVEVSAPQPIESPAGSVKYNVAEPHPRHDSSSDSSQLEKPTQKASKTNRFFRRTKPRRKTGLRVVPYMCFALSMWLRTTAARAISSVLG